MEFAQSFDHVSGKMEIFHMIIALNDKTEGMVETMKKKEPRTLLESG